MGRAAMQLMGSWDFASIQTADPAFIAGGKLGWTTFPSVPGGVGNLADIVGNPANFFPSSPPQGHCHRRPVGMAACIPC